MRSQFATSGILLISAFASSCSSRSSDTKQAPSSETSPAQERGYENAHAMVDNAKLCEPSDGVPSESACKTACELNHSNSCANWATLALTRDQDEAAALFARACKGGSGIGCEGRARLLTETGASPASLNAVFLDARRYHRIHCTQGYARSCEQLASLFETENGGPRMPEAAVSFRRQACSLGSITSCRP